MFWIVFFGVVCWVVSLLVRYVLIGLWDFLGDNLCDRFKSGLGSIFENGLKMIVIIKKYNYCCFDIGGHKIE